MFDNTAGASKYDKGSSEYLSELEKYRSADIEGKVKMHMGGKALDNRQQAIQSKRESLRIKREKDWDNLPETTKEEIKRKEKLQNAKNRKESFKRGIAKVGEFGTKNVKPITEKTRSIIGLIPGGTLIGGTKGENKK